MEKTIKYRLVGGLVLVSLVCLLLGWLSKSPMPSKAAIANLNAPAFPDQAVQVTTLKNQSTIAPQQLTTAQTTDKAPVIDTAKTNPSNPAPTLDIKALHPSIVSNTPKSSTSANLPSSATPEKINAQLAQAENNELALIKNAVWVIQLGSFKSKENALRLVNQLRQNGYQAFIQQTNTEEGNTRVYVGPENQSAVRELAERLEAELHLHGLIVNYKPLAL